MSHPKWLFTKTMKEKKQKVLVAMSGGVDSSTTAALLKRAGFDVQGVFLRLVDLPNFKQGEKGARKIAKILKIPFIVFDLRKEFRKEIINYFLKEYKAGRTPNPCVICNERVKFGFLLKKALSLGFDFLATGHYVQKKDNGTFKLFESKDKEKDQSYFLWRLTQDQLKHLLFPVGNHTKTEVRKMAKKFKISGLIKGESQDVCFIQNSINDFLEKNLKSKSGSIVEQVHYGVKRIIGRHQGLHFYTIGQRKGIKIGGVSKPLYVIDKDINKNILIVSQNPKDLEKKELICEKINWISGKRPKLPLKVRAKIRYRNKGERAVIKPLNYKRLKVVFNKKQRAITPGQSVVFYLDQQLLGGGIIESVDTL